MQDRVVVYAGSFDPITNGHLWMIEESARLFDRVIVAIGVNPEKKSFFPLHDRLTMIQQTVGHLPNVEITDFTNKYLISYALDVGASFILRGIRNTNDCVYEQQMRNVNADINSKITTVFLMPPREIAEISSSLVKGLVGPEGWQDLVRTYVPSSVFRMFKTQTTTVFVKQKWLDLYKRLNAKGDGESVFNMFEMAYSGKNRAYHTLFHIEHCLREFDEVRSIVSDPEVLEFAIWFHDEVYDPHAHEKNLDNEEESAHAAKKVARAMKLPDEFGERVAELIGWTRHKEVPTDDLLAQYLVDIDLAILGQKPEVFAEYEEGIRYEYRHVPQKIFDAVRGSILEKFLKRESIYLTPYFQKKYEVAARDNLRSSLVQLLLQV